MIINWNITLGEILLFFAAIAAFIGAIKIGSQQNEINHSLLKLQDIVEFFVSSNERKYKKDEQEIVLPVMTIYNLSNMVVYLSYYIFNGRKYPVPNVPIPPVKMFPDFTYNIDLPTNGENHVSFELYFEDAISRKWQVVAFADFTNGAWRITQSRSKRVEFD